MEDELNNCQGPPGGPDFKNLPCNVGGVGWIPSQGSKSQQAAHVLQLLSPCVLKPTQLESLYIVTKEHTCCK